MDDPIVPRAKALPDDSRKERSAAQSLVHDNWLGLASISDPIITAGDKVHPHGFEMAEETTFMLALSWSLKDNHEPRPQWRFRSCSHYLAGDARGAHSGTLRVSSTRRSLSRFLPLLYSARVHRKRNDVIAIESGFRFCRWYSVFANIAASADCGADGDLIITSRRRGPRRPFSAETWASGRHARPALQPRP